MKKYTIILSVLLVLSCAAASARERKKDTLNVEISLTDTLTKVAAPAVEAYEVEFTDKMLARDADGLFVGDGSVGASVGWVL